MPAPAPADDRKVSLVHQRLVETYGRLTLAPGGDPLDELIGTIFSAEHQRCEQRPRLRTSAHHVPNLGRGA